MKSSTPKLFKTAEVVYSWEPVAKFNKFYLAVSYKGKDEDYWLEISPQTIYVAGDETRLEKILAKWNEGANFRYERKTT